LISAPELSKHLTTSECPFCDATNNGDCPELSRKLIFAPERSKYLTTSNTRLLLLGCYSKTLDMVELILNYVDLKCLDIDFTLPSDYSSLPIGRIFDRHGSPLTAACAIGNLCIVKALLRNHADINKCSRWDESLLFIASKHGHMDVVKYLQSCGADINLNYNCGQSPLFVASQQGHCDVVEFLLKSGADINASHCFCCDAIHNGECPHLSHTLRSAPELCKNLT
jgi:ankyrin repeat protein